MTSLTNSNNAIVYGKEGCTWCQAAKSLLTEKGFTVEYKRIDLSADARTEMFTTFPGVRTVPQIVLNSTPIGDFTALNRHFTEVSRVASS